MFGQHHILMGRRFLVLLFVLIILCRFEDAYHLPLGKRSSFQYTSHQQTRIHGIQSPHLNDLKFGPSISHNSVPHVGKNRGSPLFPHSSTKNSQDMIVQNIINPSATQYETSTSWNTKTTTAKSWFPIRPQDALLTQYNTIVKGAYVRHVLVETEEMADLAIKMYLKGGSGWKSEKEKSRNESQHGTLMDTDIWTVLHSQPNHEMSDPFGALAKDLSACGKSRDEGGKIGWVMNPFFSSLLERSTDNMTPTTTMATTTTTKIHASNEGIHDLLPPLVIQRLFEAKPKGGDVLKVPSFHDTEQDTHKRWHLCRIDDVLLDYIPNSISFMTSNQNSENDLDPLSSTNQRTGSNRVITARSKVNSIGVTQMTPNIVHDTIHSSSSSSSSTSFSSTSIDPSRPIAKSYQIITHGCQMNMADSERLEGVLQNQLNLRPFTDGNNLEDSKEDPNHLTSIHTNKQSAPDIVILNTCSIRDHAEQKVYSALGPYALRKRNGEAIAIVVSGCVAQQEGMDLLRRVPEVDLVMGPQYVNRFADLLEDVSRGHQVVATDPTLLSEDLTRPVRGHKIRAWVNIIHGCNEHCTYCVVPATRGVEQSRSMESILQECLDLAKSGYKEITLLGQNIDAYGRDMIPKRTFADLLHFINDNIPSGTIERIRYVTSHPRYFSDKVIDAVASLDKVCECFHMPFQSGDDAVLRKMRRGYTFDSYMKIIQKIRERAPDASISADVIVGFPGETEEAFQRTLDLMNEVKFESVNTYSYSPRPNTEAALWENQVPEEVKKERLQIVQRLSTQHAMERSEQYIGKIVEILVEESNPKHIDQCMGRTRQNRLVFFEGDISEYEGKLVHVRITEARPWSLTGVLLE